MSKLPQVYVTETRVLIRWPGEAGDELLTTVVRQPDGKPLLGVTPKMPGDAVELARKANR